MVDHMNTSQLEPSDMDWSADSTEGDDNARQAEAVDSEFAMTLLLGDSRVAAFYPPLDHPWNVVPFLGSGDEDTSLTVNSQRSTSPSHQQIKDPQSTPHDDPPQPGIPAPVSAKSDSLVSIPPLAACLMDGPLKFETIMEVDELPNYTSLGPFEKLGNEYQAELEVRNLIQPFDKELNWSGKGQHVVFQPKDKVPLEFISHLGASATARVEMNLRHFHIVQLVGSYLQGRDFSLLMYPAADCHLGTFLEDTEDLKADMLRIEEYHARKRFLCSAFHCLASAVECVHNQSTKHMDIKPQNILVRRLKSSDGIPWRIYLSDFGLSRSFANQDHSQTDGPTSLTPKYCAPEVYEYEARGRSSDIFSLGCVYMEMLTVIAERSLHDFAEFRRNENNDESFHKNLDKVRIWMLETLWHLPCNPLFFSNTILLMVSKDPVSRPTATRVVYCFFNISPMFWEFTPRTCCNKAPEPYVVYQGPPKLHEDDFKLFPDAPPSGAIDFSYIKRPNVDDSDSLGVIHSDLSSSWDYGPPLNEWVPATPQIKPGDSSSPGNPPQAS
ncbi:hypothetical protein N0V90_005554 [Kalmusia sp. IMI 367209]|nr:hypothetical protein N0V90_005554 [Kalmusia sp. IMI 367209]